MTVHNFTSMEDLTVQEIGKLLEAAKRFKQGEKGHVGGSGFIANVFYEPSTRTKLSFEAAEKRLGLSPLNVDADHSSVQKGESLYDTVRTLQAIGAEAAVIRHSTTAFYESLQGIGIPIINAGDGSGQHPSQSILDLFTIQESFGRFHGLNVTIVGDIVHSRVAASNMIALQKLGANVMTAGPKAWSNEKAHHCRHITMEEAIQTSDVVMLLRVQHERHEERTAMNDYHEQYGLTEKREKQMKKNSIIMHPGPFNRGVEIASSVVECQRSRIFQQVENGVYCRMAILQEILQKKNIHALEGVV
ncbi:aspartate carbamoyltransferase [Geomicrobium sp. JCM 19039]|nr:aspartate carbamoyltransferase catalytic subunit [Geomicrobium sp. JCM 19039]GAK10847.1 aspartate carbamoyltransferase [Geomicrobium sp. JCM 19039]